MKDEHTERKKYLVKEYVGNGVYKTYITDKSLPEFEPMYVPKNFKELVNDSEIPDGTEIAYVKIREVARIE